MVHVYGVRFSQTLSAGANFLEHFDEPLAGRDMRLLYLFKRRQQLSRQLHIVTVALEFVDDLSLASDVPFAFGDVRAGAFQMLQEDGTIHLPTIARSCRFVRVRSDDHPLFRWQSLGAIVRLQVFRRSFWDDTRLRPTYSEAIIGEVERYTSGVTGGDTCAIGLRLHRPLPFSWDQRPCWRGP